MSPPAPIVGLIPAAGRGARFGGGVPKPFRRMAGASLLEHAVRRLSAGGVPRFVVAVDRSRVDETERELARFDVRVVVGGATRQDSVGACFEAASAGPGTLVVVHDAARPVVDPDDVRRTLEAARDAGVAVLGRAVTDTVKRVESGVIVGTVDRSGLFRAETPQVLRWELYRAARECVEAEGWTGTDESALVEGLPGVAGVAVEAKHPNPKLTYAEDWSWIEHLLAADRVSTSEEDE